MKEKGVTLVELLVVIVVITLLAAALLPHIQPAVESRRIREAARAVNVFCGVARNKATETGRPHGVMLVRSDSLPGACTLIEQVEIPPPYSGDTLSSLAQVQITGRDDGIVRLKAEITDCNAGLIHTGDSIQFNHQGETYRIRNVTSAGNDAVLELTSAINLLPRQPVSPGTPPPVVVGKALPWPEHPGVSSPVPFTIWRRPRASNAPQLQLPAGVVIDLCATGQEGRVFAPSTGSLILMFGPGGFLDGVYCGGRSYDTMRPVFLLVGKPERMPGEFGVITSEDGLANFQDLTNLYVAINPMTGLATVSEVAASRHTETPYNDLSDEDRANALRMSRGFAEQSRSLGGR